MKNGARALRAGYLNPQIHTQNIQLLIAFPVRQWLHEGASALRYTCIAGLFSHYFQYKKS